VIRFIHLFSLAFLGIVVSRCNEPLESNSKKVFRYNESAGINSLDPAYSRVLEDMRAVNQIFDGLLKLNDEMEVEPHLAKSYSISEDGKTYSFTLRKGVLFHDDEAFKSEEDRLVDAFDFEYSFKRILDPKVASPGMWIFQNIDTEKQGGIYAENDSILQIHLKKPFPAFPGVLTMQYCNVVSKEVVEFYGSDFRSHPIGCGPFKMAFWLEGVSLVLHKNETYWLNKLTEEDIPKLDAIRIDFIQDKSSMFLDFLKGNYDFISGIDQSYKDELLDQNGNLAEAKN